MKAITLTQPWATLVAKGFKRIETRSWHTNYRGPLVIHAAKSIPAWVGDWFLQNGYARAALAHCGVRQVSDLKSLPRGAVIATCELVNVISVEGFRPEPAERAFGDYGPGRFAWLLENVRAIVEPVECRGALGLWELSTLSDGELKVIASRLGIEFDRSTHLFPRDKLIQALSDELDKREDGTD
jgi:hypothetical protein